MRKSAYCADEMRTYWFEIFECGRKITLVCLPVFLSPGSPGQLIFSLIVCFLTYGIYGVFAPYEKASDDLLAQMSQLSIFFSLVSSIVLSVYPDDTLMAVLLPFFLAMPILLVILLEVKLGALLRSFTEPDEAGGTTRTGRIVQFLSRQATVSIGRAIGSSNDEQARTTGHEERTEVLASAQGLRRRLAFEAAQSSGSVGTSIAQSLAVASSSTEAGRAGSSTMQVQVEIEPEQTPAAMKMQMGLKQALAEGTSPEELAVLLVAAAGERADGLVAACSQHVANRFAKEGGASTTEGADDEAALKI